MERKEIEKALGCEVLAMSEWRPAGGGCAGHAVILVRKGENEYVTAYVSDSSLKYHEWFWGHYFQRPSAAMADFDKRRKTKGL